MRMNEGTGKIGKLVSLYLLCDTFYIVFFSEERYAQRVVTRPINRIRRILMATFIHGCLIFPEWINCFCPIGGERPLPPASYAYGPILIRMPDVSQYLDTNCKLITVYKLHATRSAIFNKFSYVWLFQFVKHLQKIAVHCQLCFTCYFTWPYAFVVWSLVFSTR